MNTKLLASLGRVLLVLVFSFSLIGIFTDHVSAGSVLDVTALDDLSDVLPGDGHCDSGAGCTLRAAIEEANALVGANKITFNGVGGTLTIGSELPVISDNLTIEGGFRDIIISGDGLSRVLSIGSGVVVTLQKLTISNGNAGTGNGGGVANGGTLTVTDCTFRGNHAQNGGAIENAGGGTLTITNSTFFDNTAANGGGIDNTSGTLIVTGGTYKYNRADKGGWIYNSDSATMTNSYLTGNTALIGGGVYNEGDITISTSHFYLNRASLNGGGIYVLGGSLTVTNTSFNHNIAAANGGGIASLHGTLVLTNSTFDSNSAVDGAGINSQSGDLTVANSTFAYNIVSNRGGGIFGAVDTLPNMMTVINSTFSGNGAAHGGGGIYNLGSTMELKNTILANSQTLGDCYSNTSLSMDVNNLIETNSGCGTPLFSRDPVLVYYLGQNGGHTRTFALTASSPAVDAGDDATCAAFPVSGLDQRGVTRPHGAHCDIGSYEQKKFSLIVQSVGVFDGYILESGENTNVGGTRDSTSGVFRLGDGAGDKQYRAILSFNTAALPDNADITTLTLRIKKQGLIGTDPFAILGLLTMDIQKPFFGTIPGLVVSDFQVAAGKSRVNLFGTTPVSNWYSFVTGAMAHPFINRTGHTQIRLRFTIDDNNDGTGDYMKFYSGNYVYAASRPVLVIEYFLP